MSTTDMPTEPLTLREAAFKFADARAALDADENEVTMNGVTEAWIELQLAALREPRP